MASLTDVRIQFSAAPQWGHRARLGARPGKASTRLRAHADGARLVQQTMDDQTNRLRRFTVIELALLPIVAQSLLMPFKYLPELVRQQP
ncbi:MAG: hypothetical protein ABSD30_18410 [Candidatus Binatus sp.]